MSGSTNQPHESGVYAMFSEYLRKADYWKHMTALGGIATVIVSVLVVFATLSFNTISGGFDDVRQDIRDLRGIVQEISMRGKGSRSHFPAQPPDPFGDNSLPVPAAAILPDPVVVYPLTKGGS